jgi:hypothetical protein
MKKVIGVIITLFIIIALPIGVFNTSASYSGKAKFKVTTDSYLFLTLNDLKAKNYTLKISIYLDPNIELQPLIYDFTYTYSSSTKYVTAEGEDKNHSYNLAVQGKIQKIQDVYLHFDPDFFNSETVLKNGVFETQLNLKILKSNIIQKSGNNKYNSAPDFEYSLGVIKISGFSDSITSTTTSKTMIVTTSTTSMSTTSTPQKLTTTTTKRITTTTKVTTTTISGDDIVLEGAKLNAQKEESSTDGAINNVAEFNPQGAKSVTMYLKVNSNDTEVSGGFGAWTGEWEQEEFSGVKVGSDKTVAIDYTVPSKVGSTIKAMVWWPHDDDVVIEKIVLHMDGSSVTPTTKATTTTRRTTTTTKKITTTVKVTTTTQPISIGKTEITMKNGEQYVIPANRNDLTYKSNNNDIAIVSSKGIITAVGTGNAVISVIDSEWNVVQINVTVTTSAKQGLPGDANMDNTVDLSDAVLIMQSLANPNKYGLTGSDKSHLTEQGAANADVEGGNGITANDALTIQQYLLKIIAKLPV